MEKHKPVKNILSISDLNYEQLFNVILPKCEKEIPFVEKRIPRESDPTKKVQLLFTEPSTRTRGSNIEAVELLGYRYDQVIGEEASALAKRESLANTARMFAKYNAGVIVARTKIEGAQKFMAKLLEKDECQCAVHNAGDGTNQHPTQTILDLLTLKRHLGRLDDLTIGFFGDLKYGRTVHSLLSALSYRSGINVVLVDTPETKLQKQYRELFPAVTESDEMEALVDCDVVYGARIQEERFDFDPIILARLRARFTVTSQLLNSLKKNVIIMHPMPYVQEFPPDVRKDKRIIIDDQAWCGVPVRVALLKLSFENLETKVFPEDRPDIVLDTIEDVSLAEYRLHKARKNEEENQYFYPIDCGTVIDHIPVSTGPKIKQFLIARGQLKNEGPVHLIDRIKKTRHEEKEVLILRNNFLEDRVKMAIVSLSPMVTFNEISGEKFRKIKANIPSKVYGFGKCPNKTCITNNDPEAVPTFTHTTAGSLKCWYCEKEFLRDEVI
ncbi:MAG: aspartate carbamoyltransferase regulatory subunit [Patescibacteria group bacterium]|nr:aspartate carbamoyltransferase regulatory subunit [Patescibacteria group bacterium]